MFPEPALDLPDVVTILLTDFIQYNKKLYCAKNPSSAAHHNERVRQFQIALQYQVINSGVSVLRSLKAK